MKLSNIWSKITIGISFQVSILMGMSSLTQPTDFGVKLEHRMENVLVLIPTGIWILPVKTKRLELTNKSSAYQASIP